jgi:hypothetical protein
MTPTPKLRFVERDSYSRNGEHFVQPHKVRILQQWWDFNSGAIPPGQWRDVPIEKESE